MSSQSSVDTEAADETSRNIQKPLKHPHLGSEKKRKKGFRVAICQNHGLILAPFFYASILFLSAVCLRYPVDTCQLVPFGVHIATVSQ